MRHFHFIERREDVQNEVEGKTKLGRKEALNLYINASLCRTKKGCTQDKTVISEKKKSHRGDGNQENNLVNQDEKGTSPERLKRWQRRWGHNQTQNELKNWRLYGKSSKGDIWYKTQSREGKACVLRNKIAST